MSSRLYRGQVFRCPAYLHFEYYNQKNCSFIAHQLFSTQHIYELCFFRGGETPCGQQQLLETPKIHTNTNASAGPYTSSGSRTGQATAREGRWSRPWGSFHHHSTHCNTSYKYRQTLTAEPLPPHYAHYPSFTESARWHQETPWNTVHCLVARLPRNPSGPLTPHTLSILLPGLCVTPLPARNTDKRFLKNGLQIRKNQEQHMWNDMVCSKSAGKVTTIFATFRRAGWRRATPNSCSTVNSRNAS